MAKLTQKKVEEQIRLLKDIKPNQAWADLLLSQVMGETPMTPAKKAPATFAGIFANAGQVFSKSRMAYAFAALALVLIGGVIGVEKLAAPKTVAVQSAASLNQTAFVSENTANLANQINNFSKAVGDATSQAQQSPKVIAEIQTNASALTKALKAQPANSNNIKEVASSLKTLADVKGSTVSQDPDVQDLYQTVVESQIKDLQGATLTADEQKQLQGAEDSYAQGNYMEALEVLLTITPATASTGTGGNLGATTSPATAPSTKQ
jgi:hypothetical protein